MLARARAAGVAAFVLPAVERANFGRVRRMASEGEDIAFALGIHPLYVERAQARDIDVLRAALEQGGAVAVGEIGLDFFVPGLDRVRQEWFFVEQLKLARELGLPVLLHVRRSQDDILKHVRRIFGRVGPGGIAHAFNGSRQQAQAYIDLGFMLGFGGAMTWARALRIRALAASLPLDALVLETDAPDIAPEFAAGLRNEPAALLRIAETMAHLRGIPVEALVAATGANALRALPGLAALPGVSPGSGLQSA